MNVTYLLSEEFESFFGKRIDAFLAEVMEGKMTVSAVVMEALEIFLGQKK